MPEGMAFTLTIGGQEILVCYRPRYFAAADYAHFEFTSPFNPRRRIPLSDTGYRSHFSPMHEVEAAPDVLEYARVLAIALMDAEKSTGAAKDVNGQLDLF